MQKVEFGTLNERNAVFIAFHLKSKVYQGYKSVSEEIQNREIPQVLLLQRWDSKLGFVGGMVDEGEDLITAAKREAMEEINFDFDLLNHLELKPVCSHQSKPDMNLHLFSVEIDSDYKKMIQKNAMAGSDFEAEVCGLVFQQIFRMKGRGFDEFLENGYFAPAVREELEELIEKEKLLA